MRRGGRLNNDDLRLWRAVAKTVRPLRAAAPKPPPPEAPAAPQGLTPLPPAPAPHQAPPPPALQALPKPRRLAAPADRGGEKRVRRGRLALDATLDLHGFGQDRARAALRAFLLRAAADGARTVIVVTGKGGRLVNGEAAPGVLRQRLPEWLAQPEFRILVSSYAQANPKHGGEGAYYVFLRAKPVER